MKAKSSFIFRQLDKKHADLLRMVGIRYGIKTTSAALSHLLDRLPGMLDDSSDLTQLRDACLRFAEQASEADSAARKMDVAKRDIIGLARSQQKKLPKQLRLD